MQKGGSRVSLLLVVLDLSTPVIFSLSLQAGSLWFSVRVAKTVTVNLTCPQSTFEASDAPTGVSWLDSKWQGQNLSARVQINSCPGVRSCVSGVLI